MAKKTSQRIKLSISKTHNNAPATATEQVHEEEQEVKGSEKHKQSELFCCPLCDGRSFPSKKSLYGHMRCHPERPWRGIVPPVSPAIKQGSSFIVTDTNPAPTSLFKLDFGSHQNDSADSTKSQDCDLSRDLSGWSVTAKRGRRSLSSTSNSHASSFSDEKMQEGMYGLMLLANSTPQISDQASNNELNIKLSPNEVNQREGEDKLINGTATENVEALRREGGRRGLDIDLNELPAMEDDDDDH